MHPNYFAMSSSELLMNIYKVSTRKELERIDIPNNIFVNHYKKYQDMILDGDLFLAKEDYDAIDIFVYINVPNDEILKRRIADKTRIRHMDIFEIDRLVKANLVESLHIPKPVYVIDNVESVAVALEKLEKLVAIYEDKVLTTDELRERKARELGFITTKKLIQTRERGLL